MSRGVVQPSRLQTLNKIDTQMIVIGVILNVIISVPGSFLAF